jgi:hypothetical protein
MIMSCMNFTSAGECGGNVARVEEGSVRVGWPGAPGWTTIGVAGSACCAETDSDNKHVRVAARSHSLRLVLHRKRFIGVDPLNFDAVTLSQHGPNAREYPL